MPRHIYRTVFLIAFSIGIFLPFFTNAQALVNINTADVAELDALPGIGPAYAQRIVDYRTANGLFQRIEDIQNVSGIGPSTFADLKDLITVGSTNSGNNVGTAAQTNNQTNQISQDESAHYSAVSLTNVSKTPPARVSAGRDRIGAVGSPLEFKAEIDGKDSTGRQNIYRWNFGDGMEGGGPIITHTYEYSGEYIVVLNANLPEGEAIARVNVKIIAPEIVIASANPERIELKNNSKYETNLFGRALIVGGRAFVFPRDTIIKAGQSIFFSSRATGLNPSGIYEAQVMVIGDTEQPKIYAKIEERKAEKIALIQNQIAVLRQKVASISAPAPHSAGQLSEENDELVVEKPLDQDKTGIIEVETQTAAAHVGWFAFLKRFFLRTQ